MDAAWQSDPLWYKDAIIYHLHVRAYADSNHDGIGDFPGLTRKLDYIQHLGVNTLWLLPFYPSPLRDDGYDIADYRNIHPDYGVRRDFRTFIREAHQRGLKVITELVINHTSDQHPWFQAARAAPRGSRKRNYYVWSDSDKKFPETRIIFTDTEKSNWAWDPVAQQYYWHRFFSHQPDLNHDNPQVVRAMIRLMRLWLDLGVDGLRLDAIPYLCVREGTDNENLPETHQVIKQMRAVVDAHYRNRIFLAEANQWPEDVRDYFGDGDECHMAFHFPLMPRMYMAIAQEDRHPIAEILDQTPDIPANCQWAIFLRNHDELTLEMVTDRERDYMYRRYASDLRMRVNVGIRRRLAPLMDNDLDQMKLMNSLLLSMPGSPIIYYGDEIGMGDNIYLGDRNSVRTPMQWSPDRNAGFSRADPQRLYLPPIMDPIYGYPSVNVEAQSREPSSLLNWMRRLLEVRKAFRAFGRGSLELLRPGNRKVLAYVREYENESILCVANLAGSAQPVELDLSRFKTRVPVELQGRTSFPPIGELPYLLTLPRHGFYWFQLATDAPEPPWHEARLPAADLPVLVLFAGWRSFASGHADTSAGYIAERSLRQFERDVLPRHLESRRWFAAKGVEIRGSQMERTTPWPERDQEWLVGWIRVDLAGMEPQRYFLPLAVRWGETEDEAIRPFLPNVLARVRRRARVGVLYDALADPEFCRALVESIGAERAFPFGPGRLEFSATSAYADAVAGAALEQMRRPEVESSNTAIVLGDRVFLKVYRRLREGINPEAEVGRFLTEVSPFAHAVPLAGAIEYVEADRRTAVAVLQRYVEHQGDAWRYTLDYLERVLETVRLPGGDALLGRHTDYRRQIQVLGRRTAELHAAFSRVSGDPAFDPEPIHEADLTHWKDRILEDLIRMLERLERQTGELEPAAQEITRRLLAAREILVGKIGGLAPSRVHAVKTRHHGDYHLGQVLVAENDFIITDFEGEPARPLEERRVKHSPLRDVACMLRSFSYAAESALERAAALRVETRTMLAPCARAWERIVGGAFVNAYFQASAGQPHLPEKADALRLIRLFALEKALYEVHYELDHRPGWVARPLRGLLEFVA